MRRIVQAFVALVALALAPAFAQDYPKQKRWGQVVTSANLKPE